MYHNYLAIPNISYSYHNFSVLVELAFLCRLFLQRNNLLSAFSQSPALPLSRAEHVPFKPVIDMLLLFILHPVPAACSFSRSSEPQAEGRAPRYSQRCHGLRLLERCRERCRPPSAPSTAALRLPTPSPWPPPAAASGRPQGAACPGPCRPDSRLGCGVALGEYRQSLYAFLLEGKRQAAHGILLLFPAKEKKLFYDIQFRRGAEEGEMAPRLQHPH